jgi:hypothetical protein
MHLPGMSDLFRGEKILLLLGLICLTGGIRHTVFAETSELWGTDGSRWTARSRLPNFSYAGYHAGEAPIPTPPVTKNVVTDFGANGSDDVDDTAAFQRAIADTSNGALFIPAGRYRIEKILAINKSHFVLRGAGQSETTLYFPRSLGEILGRPAGKPYGGGLIVFTGRRQGEKLASVTTHARRGDQVLAVSSTAGLTPGRRVRLRMTNSPDNSLGCHIFAERGCLSQMRRSLQEKRARQKEGGGAMVDWVVDIQAVSEHSITLARPLRLDVRVEWRPEIWSHQPTVTEVGIEDLSIEFPNVQYAGHLQEAGFHAIYLERVEQSWVRRVTIQDADRGIEITGAFNTVSEVTLQTRWRHLGWSRSGATGHYGFQIHTVQAQDNLVTDSRLAAVYVHNMAVSDFANGNVYSRITAKTPLFDHHHTPVYENLFTEIVLTESGEGLLQSGGEKGQFTSGARTTLWNIRTLGRPFSVLGSADAFPQMNMVGMNILQTVRPPDTSSEVWVERWPGENTVPPNLYQAQLNRRLRR